MFLFCRKRYLSTNFTSNPSYNLSVKCAKLLDILKKLHFIVFRRVTCFGISPGKFCRTSPASYLVKTESCKYFIIIIIIFIFRYKHKTKITKNSHTIGGLPEKPYSSLTGYPNKKNKFSTVILYNKVANKKQQHCVGAIGYVQYHKFKNTISDFVNT